MKNKFIPCRICKNKKGPRPGFYYEMIDYGETKTPVVTECNCHKEWKHKNIFYNNAATGHIWPESLSYNPDTDYQGQQSRANVNRLKKYADNFDEYSDAMVYMYGPNGTQKTSLAQWIGAKVLNEGKTVRYTLMQYLLETLSKMTRIPEEEEAKQREIKTFQNVDLLIIDEAFGADKVTLYNSGFQLPFLDRFLRERFEIKKKGIIFISNHSPEEISQQKFSRSQEDFIKRKTRPFGTALEFLDNYVETTSHFDVKGIFD